MCDARAVGRRRDDDVASYEKHEGKGCVLLESNSSLGHAGMNQPNCFVFFSKAVEGGGGG